MATDMLDHVLQRQRIRRVRRHIRTGDFVLDFGCNDGRLFRLLGHLMDGGIGIDHEPCSVDNWKGMGENFQFQLGGLELLTPENLPESISLLLLQSLSIFRKPR